MQGTVETFRIELMSRFAVSRNGQPVDLSHWQRRHARLVRMLAASPGHRLMRDVVIEHLWPDSSLEAGSTNLRYAVHLIRRALPESPPSIDLEREWVSLSTAYNWVVDLVQFEEAAAGAADELEELERTVKLYTGAPLPEDNYEDWARPIQDRVAVQWRTLRFRLIREYRANGRLDDAIFWCRSLLESDPVDEPAMQELMTLLAETGQAPEALQRYHAWAELLWDEVGVRPAPETQDLSEQLTERIGIQDGDEGTLLPLPTASALPLPPGRRERAELWVRVLAVAALVVGAGLLSFSVFRKSATPTSANVSLPILGSWSANISQLIHFKAPTYVAVGPHDTIYITDRSAPRLQELSPRGEIIRRWRTLGRTSTVVTGLTIDPRGHPYISDAHCSCILKLSASGRVLQTWGKRGTAAGQFNHPAGLDLDTDGNLYVADMGNNRIQKLSSDGKPLRIWGKESLKLRSPRDIAVSSTGEMYVADTGNDRIVRLSASGRLINVWGHPGTGPGEFHRPTAIDLSPRGDVFVVDSDNQRIQRISPATHRVAIWGKTGLPGSQGRHFRDPIGIAVDQTGSIYVADTANSRVQKLSATGHPTGIWDADQSLSPELARPTYVTVDRQGNLFVSDTGNNRILKYSRDGIIVDRWGHTGSDRGEFLHPTGLVVDGDGSLYVADSGNNRIQQLSPHGHPLRIWGSGGTGVGELNSPEGLTLDQQGNLFVVDRGNARIDVLNIRRPVQYPHGFRVLTLPPGWTLNQPKGIALDGKNRLYVADSGNRRILVLYRRGRQLRSLPGPRGSALFDPTGLTVGPDKQLYVTDTFGSCVDSADTSSQLPALREISCAHLHAPGGIVVGSRGRLFVADTEHSRILVLDSDRSHVTSSARALTAWQTEPSGYRASG